MEVHKNNWTQFDDKLHFTKFDTGISFMISIIDFKVVRNYKLIN